MPASSNRLSISDLPSFVDDDFLTKVVEILDRLGAQSELRGHPLLASVLAIAKDEAEDDLRTRLGEFEKGGLLSEADSSVVLMAQRFACGSRTVDVEESAGRSTHSLIPWRLMGGKIPCPPG